MIVVDDALLLGVLAGAASRQLEGATAGREFATTGSWYWRLARAVLGPTSTGTLSRAFADLTEEGQSRVSAKLRSLPPEIGLVGLRRLVPVMAAVDSGRSLNLLTAEAVAAALVLDAGIAVTTRSSVLEAACQRVGVDIILIA